jgi:hypothetical protein
LTPSRPFLSYSNADRDLVEPVATRIAARGLAPIYDHWWLRSPLGDERIGGSILAAVLAELELALTPPMPSRA